MFSLFAFTFEGQQYTVRRQDLHMGSPTIYATVVKRDLDGIVLAVRSTLNSCSQRNPEKQTLLSSSNIWMNNFTKHQWQSWQSCLQFRKWSPPLSWTSRLHCLLHKQRLKHVHFILGHDELLPSLCPHLHTNLPLLTLLILLLTLFSGQRTWQLHLKT